MMRTRTALGLFLLATLILGAPGRSPWTAMAQPWPVANPAPKGLNVHPNELPAQVDKIAAADTNWVRLEFRMGPEGLLDLDKYDEVVEAILAAGMGVIGLVDYMTIPDDWDGDGVKDYGDPVDYPAYEGHFLQVLEELAEHFVGRIDHWEIWNEENGAQWHIAPENYASLLVAAAEVVKEAGAGNTVLFGGLEHVWVTSQYLEPFYAALDANWGGARPFDIMAVHPYPDIIDGRLVLDPNVYLWEPEDPSRTTLDKYLAYMASMGDGDKDIWITEIGWNSALDNPAIENCPAIKPYCVTRAQQAQYLRDSFDILFKKVEDPQGRHDRVTAIVWYQYQDTGVELARLAAKYSIDLSTLRDDPQTICPADWGLVDGNRVPKPSYWAFQAYRARWLAYVPLVRK